MQLKYEWIESRRHQISKQTQQCETQSKAFFSQLFAELKSKSDQLSKLKDLLKSRGDTHQEELMRTSTQLKTLESIVAAKEDQLARIRQELDHIRKSNQHKNEQIQQMTNRILQLEHSLLVVQEQSNKRVAELTHEVENIQNRYRDQLTQMVRLHEAQLFQLQNRLNSEHESALAQLKKTNLRLIQTLESENQAILNKGIQSTKQNESDYQRIVNQNKRLSTSVNELKLKVLNLEANFNTSQQQLKISGKETQLMKENFRRQSEYLKDEKASLKQKNKALTQKIDEYAWQIRELKLNKEQEMKRIQTKIDQSFKEVAERAEQDVKDLEKQNQLLKAALAQKQLDLKQLQQVSLKIKQLFEQQQKDLIAVKGQKQAMARQQNNSPGIIKINEQLKSQVIRKNCEIQVMQDEIKRLKSKINNAANIQQEYAKFKDMMQKQNKMLLSEIVFLRQKDKKSKKKDASLSASHILSDLHSEQSKAYEDVDQYKKIIQLMADDMNEAKKKIIDKDIKIQKLQAQIQKLQAQIKRYQRQLQSS